MAKFTLKQKVIIAAALTGSSSGNTGGEGVTPDNVRIIDNGESRFDNKRAQRTITD